MAKTSEEYWRNRALELEEKWHDKSQATIEKELAAYYRQSLRHIQRDIEALYGTFAKDNQLSMTDARKLLQGDEFRVWRMDIKDYIDEIHRLEQAGAVAKGSQLLRELNTLAMRSRITRLDKLYSETLMELSKLAEKTGHGMDKFLTEAYKDGYYRNLFEIGKKAGLKSTPVKVDNRQSENVLRTPWSGKNYSERIWRNDARLAQTIRETVEQGIHRGSSLQKLSKQVADRMGVGINDAKRLVQTELNYVQNRAALDSIKESGIGFFRVIAAHDARTCQRCGDKDGSEVAVGDASPGDTLPPFHARCRCTIAASFGDGQRRGGKRVARDRDGNNIRIPADMKYADWKAVYIDKTKTLASWENSLANSVQGVNITRRSLRDSGATVGALNDKNDPDWERRDAHAESYYQEIRNSKKAPWVERIARNSGMSELAVGKVYDHVFIDEHDLEDGYRRFDPSYDMSESFRRLSEGKDIQPHDLIMLQHEHLERELMTRYKKSYSEAHRLTNKKHNYDKALRAWKEATYGTPHTNGRN